MEILLWLVPTVVVTCAAMVWVGWLGRAGRGEVDREVAVARLAVAMEKEHPQTRAASATRAPERSTGIAVRATRAADREANST